VTIAKQLVPARDTRRVSNPLPDEEILPPPYLYLPTLLMNPIAILADRRDRLSRGAFLWDCGELFRGVKCVSEFPQK
jgi:hypothetical protein